MKSKSNFICFGKLIKNFDRSVKVKVLYAPLGGKGLTIKLNWNYSKGVTDIQTLILRSILHITSFNVTIPNTAIRSGTKNSDNFDKNKLQENIFSDRNWMIANLMYGWNNSVIFWLMTFPVVSFVQIPN